MADSPPAATAGASRPKPPPSGVKQRPAPAPKRAVESLETKIGQGVTGLGMLVGMGDPVSGFILIANADDFATAWAEVAEINPRVRAVLEGLFAKSVYANAFAATAAIVVPLGTRAGLIPRVSLNPAVGTIENMERLVTEQGYGVADLIKMHEQAKTKMAEARAEFDRMMADAANANGDEPTPDAPDHFTVS